MEVRDIFKVVEIHPPTLWTNPDGSQTFVNHTIERDGWGEKIKEEFSDGITIRYQ